MYKLDSSLCHNFLSFNWIYSKLHEVTANNAQVMEEENTIINKN
jgi:hypothetical protein